MTVEKLKSVVLELLTESSIKEDIKQGYRSIVEYLPRERLENMLIILSQEKRLRQELSMAS
jgi:hypothetical protein